jgi:hypothetical protein
MSTAFDDAAGGAATQAWVLGNTIDDDRVNHFVTAAPTAHAAV